MIARARLLTRNRRRAPRVVEHVSVKVPSMSRTPPSSRWLAWLACCAALALAGCAAPGSPAGPARAPARAGRPTPQAVSAVARCAGAMLRIKAGRQGENGGAHGDIEFINTGARSCVLRGLPVVRIVQAGAAPLPVRLVRAHGLWLSPAVLPPGRPGAADLIVFWSNWCGPRPGPLRVQITLPTGDVVTGPFDGPPDYDYVPRCDSPALPSTISVIDAYVPGHTGHD